MFISPEHGRALLCAGNSDGMDEAFESIFFCWEACQDEPEGGFISNRGRTQERGRSRTRRMNINSFDSGSTRTRRTNFNDSFDDGISTKDVETKIYLKRTSSFTLEADKSNEKSGKKDPEDTVGDIRKRERKRRRRQRMNARMQRTARKNDVRPVNSNAETTVESNETNHPKDLKNSRKQLENIPVSTTTQDTRPDDGHSKANVGPANKNKQLSSQKGEHQNPTERSTAEATKSQQRQKSPQKLRKIFQVSDVRRISDQQDR